MKEPTNEGWNTEVNLWPWFPFHYCLALMLVIFQELLSHSHHVQELVGKYPEQLGWRSGESTMSICSVNDEGILNSSHQLRRHHKEFSFSLAWHELFDPLLRAWIVDGMVQSLFPQLGQCNINGKNNDEISAMLSFDGGSHCSVHTNVGSIIYYNDSRASLGKFVQGFLYNFNKWLEFSIPKGFNLTSFSQIGGQLWFSTEPFIQFFNFSPIFPLFSLFFFDRYFGACCRPDDWIRNWILQILM